MIRPDDLPAWRGTDNGPACSLCGIGTVYVYWRQEHVPCLTNAWTRQPVISAKCLGCFARTSWETALPQEATSVMVRQEHDRIAARDRLNRSAASVQNGGNEAGR